MRKVHQSETEIKPVMVPYIYLSTDSSKQLTIPLMINTPKFKIKSLMRYTGSYTLVMYVKIHPNTYQNAFFQI